MFRKLDDINALVYLCSSGEEVISSEEDVAFTDDVNDQSYDPKYERWILVFCMFLCVSSLSHVSYSLFIL